MVSARMAARNSPGPPDFKSPMRERLNVPMSTRPIFTGAASRKAVARLETGPAPATRETPLMPWDRRYSFTGTGLPQPNPATRNSIEPAGSRWRRGFSDTRPWQRAVASPRPLATIA